MNTGPQEKTIKELFLGKCWEYLNNNFHKFSKTNQIKIALELCKKDLPTQLQGNLNVTIMPEVKINGQPLEIKIG